MRLRESQGLNSIVKGNNEDNELKKAHRNGPEGWIKRLHHDFPFVKQKMTE